MKKTTYLIVLLFSMQFVLAQSDSDYQNAIAIVSDGYNSNNAQKIFDAFSADLQSSFTLDKVKTFISKNQSTKGTMGESSFLLDDNGSKRYLTEFENASSILVIKLTADNKINQLALEEY